MKLVKIIALIVILETVLILLMKGKLIEVGYIIYPILITVLVVGAPVLFILGAWFGQLKTQKFIHLSLFTAIIGSYIALYTCFFFWKIPFGFPYINPKPENIVDISDLVVPNGYFVLVTTIVFIGSIWYEVNLYIRRKNLKIPPINKT